MSATLALCRFGRSGGVALFSKKLTFAGWLEHLESLAGDCACPPHVVHAIFNSWDAARPPGQDPAELNSAYAALVIRYVFGDALGNLAVGMGKVPKLLILNSCSQLGGSGR